MRREFSSKALEVLDKLCDCLKQFCDSNSSVHIILQAELVKCRGMPHIICCLHLLLAILSIRDTWCAMVGQCEAYRGVCVCVCVCVRVRVRDVSF